jgi:hypothetical protein
MATATPPDFSLQLTFHGIFFVETGGGSVGSVGRWRKSLGIKEDGRKRKREKVF